MIVHDGGNAKFCLACFLSFFFFPILMVFVHFLFLFFPFSPSGWFASHSVVDTWGRKLRMSNERGGDASVTD